jgi:hypothetical protein
MIKGEHLRPLVGFLMVSAAAALILTTGVSAPATLRRIVTEQRVLPSTGLTELVLGQTFDPAPAASVPRSPAASEPGAAAAQRTSLVLSSFGQAPEVTSASAASTHAKPQTRHHQVVKTASAHASTTTVVPAQADPAPQPGPTATPVTPVTPVKDAFTTSGSHHAAQALPTTGSSDATATPSIGEHTQHHSRGTEGRHSGGGHHGGWGTRGPTQHTSAGSVAEESHAGGGSGWHGDHSHGDHTHGDHSHGGYPQGEGSPGGHSHGHHH